MHSVYCINVMVVISKISCIKLIKYSLYCFPVFGVAVINATSSPEFTFPSDELKTTGDEKINVPSSVFHSETGEYFECTIV